MPKIEIVQPRPEWGEEFLNIARLLQQQLGSLALRIDHIGSTAIAELPAKDVIDIQVTVKSLQVAQLIPAIEKAGFVLVANNSGDNLIGLADGSDQLKKLFFHQPPQARRCHIHVREHGRINQQYPLLFRDFLRAHTEIRQAYGKIKQELAIRFADDAGAYYAIKDPYMDTIYQAALIWAKQIGWSDTLYS